MMSIQLNAEQWAHLEIVGTVLVPILLFWWDTRRRSREQHAENSHRLTRIETKIDPLWDWWNDRRNNGD